MPIHGVEGSSQCESAEWLNHSGPGYATLEGLNLNYGAHLDHFHTHMYTHIYIYVFQWFIRREK